MAFSPLPPLDGAPPSPPGINAAPPPGAGKNANFAAMTPQTTAQPASDSALQLIQMALQASANVSKLLQLLGQLLPGFGPVAAQLDVQLRGGIKAALQQGLTSSMEPPAAPQLDLLGQQAGEASGGSMMGSLGGVNG